MLMERRAEFHDSVAALGGCLQQAAAQCHPPLTRVASPVVRGAALFFSCGKTCGWCVGRGMDEGPNSVQCRTLLCQTLVISRYSTRPYIRASPVSLLVAESTAHAWLQSWGNTCEGKSQRSKKDSTRPHRENRVIIGDIMFERKSCPPSSPPAPNPPPTSSINRRFQPDR